MFLQVPMANESMMQGIANISMTDIMKQVFPSDFLTNFSFLMTLSKVIGIVFLVYLLFLIIQSFIKVRQALRLKSIDKNIEEINKKLDIIVAKKSKKHQE